MAVPMAVETGAGPQKRKPIYAQLYVQVLVAIALGIALGHFYPQLGESLKPLGDAFIKLVKMIIAPVIFCTIVLGIGSVRAAAEARAADQACGGEHGAAGQPDHPRRRAAARGP